MFYEKLKIFIKRSPFIWKLLRWLKDSLLKLFRIKDVFMMMILFHLWPEQMYRFSTRNQLPYKKNRFSKESRPKIPYDFLESKSSKIKKMKEINLVARGRSFDMQNIKNFNVPTFLITFYSPLIINDEGNVISEHMASYETGDFESYYKEKKFLSNKVNKEFEKEKLTYIARQGDPLVNFKKKGYNVFSLDVYVADKDGNHHSLSSKVETTSHRNLFDDDKCKCISVAEKVYLPSHMKPDQIVYSKFGEKHPLWAPTGSVVPTICAFLNFAEKINVYGWDFYVESSPEKMSYWQLFFNMYKYKLDLYRSRNHFESALINFYYGYHFSKFPNVNIHGYMGQLDKHEKLIKKIERVLFN